MNDELTTMWFGIKRVASERRTYVQSDSIASDKLAYSFGINDCDAVMISRPEIWSPTTNFMSNIYSNDSVSCFMLKMICFNTILFFVFK